METIIGDAMLIVFGNHDVLGVLVKFSVSIGGIGVFLKLWKYFEGGR